MTGSPKFCLTGTFHSANRGDAAIQLSAVLELRRRYPDAEIVLLSSSPGDDAPVYPEARVVATVRRKPAQALLTLLRAGAGRLAERRDWSGAGGELAEIASADVVIDLSGDGFTETFGWKCPAAHAVPVLQARLLGIPCLLMAQTIGPFTRGTTFYRTLFRGSQGVLCRDAESVSSLGALGVKDRVALTADVAFLLPAAKAGELERACPWIDGFAPRAPLISVTPSNLYNVRTSTERSRLLRALARSAELLADRTGARILIVPTVFGPGACYDDRNAAREVHGFLSQPDRARIVTEPLSPRLLKSLLGRCDMCLGMRMHGLILSMSQTVPCLGVAYGPKTGHLFRRLGVEEFAVEMGAASEDVLDEMVLRLWEQRAAVRETIGRSLVSDIFPSAHRNFEILDDLLTGRMTK